MPKDAGTLPGGDVALGDRTNLVFQNTQVTRGTAVFVVTGTGTGTEMGRIAGMVTATKRTKSPLQVELDGMTTVFGLIAFAAVAVIAVFGLVRGMDTTTLVLLCISTAIASIPTGLPTFVQTTRFVEAHIKQGRFVIPEAVTAKPKELFAKIGDLSKASKSEASCLEFFPPCGQGPQATGALLEKA